MEGFSICSALILFRFTSVSNFQMAELRQSIHKILCEDTISNEDRLIAVFQMLTSAAIYQVLSLFWNGILKMFDLLIIIFWCITSNYDDVAAPFPACHIRSWLCKYLRHETTALGKHFWLFKNYRKWPLELVDGASQDVRCSNSEVIF